ncbi:hypothetical protein CAEBREN_13268 [Caenorhabditis brenneri]|uniref:Uncharacterized protein n=1 Tax=Caenorhabditis brenneri TaxID=135651 RepID=G0PDJ1_CAEBE|nr:hypothetical protein CAEBREN_13268 [Caenorhabditis brenneri]
MISSTTITLLSSLAIVTSGFSVRTPPKNTVQDAHEQLNKLIRCWEPIDSAKPASGYTLSEPIYELCSYMPDPKDYNKFYVNGVEMDSDDYTNVLAMYANPIPGYGMLNVCLQEAFQFHAANHPSQTSLRCLCKREGCNLPKGFTTFLDFNKLPMPEVAF